MLSKNGFSRKMTNSITEEKLRKLASAQDCQGDYSLGTVDYPTGKVFCAFGLREEERTFTFFATEKEIVPHTALGEFIRHSRKDAKRLSSLISVSIIYAMTSVPNSYRPEWIFT